jgi:hypothetical protein
VGIAGDNAVCVNRINTVVPVRITTDFHAAKEISSDLDLSNDDVDIRGKLDRMDINLVHLFLRDSRLKLVIEDTIGGHSRLRRFSLNRCHVRLRVISLYDLSPRNSESNFKDDMIDRS